MACSQYRAVFMSSCHQTCVAVCRYESVCQLWAVCRSVWRFISALSSESESLLCVSMCVSILRRCSRVAGHSTEAPRSSPGLHLLLSPRLSGRKVLMAAAMPRLPEHLLWVTLLFHCHLAPSDSTGNERPAISVSASETCT